MNAKAVAMVLALLSGDAQAQGFGGLGTDAPGFAAPKPGAALVFPRDHGAHPNFRTEWWYLTANLKGADGASYGVQWTLFRHALEPKASRDGLGRPQYMDGPCSGDERDRPSSSRKSSRAAASSRRASRRRPFTPSSTTGRSSCATPAPDAGDQRLRVHARDENFAYHARRLTADAPLVLQGDSRLQPQVGRGQASYYFSQPFFEVDGSSFSLDGREMKVAGRAWMDREWSSQPLAPDQKGWDWFSLHLAGGEKLMLFRLRSATAAPFPRGNWIAPTARRAIAAARIFRSSR